MIKEVIVVEGRDDTNAIRRAVMAETIETHGFGITEDTWQLLAKAYEEKGLIVFTDPDHAGEAIRRRILERFPNAKEAFLDRAAATDGGDVGIENASPEDIRGALAKVAARGGSPEDPYTMKDLMAAGLMGGPGSRERREQAGRMLGIGYGNAAAFLRKLNAYGVSRADWTAALKELGE